MEQVKTTFQIFASIGNGPLIPHRKYETMDSEDLAEGEALAAFEAEEEVAQHSADYTRQMVSIELRNITKNQILRHKRFDPRTITLN